MSATIFAAVVTSFVTTCFLMRVFNRAMGDTITTLTRHATDYVTRRPWLEAMPEYDTRLTKAEYGLNQLATVHDETARRLDDSSVIVPAPKGLIPVEDDL